MPSLIHIRQLQYLTTSLEVLSSFPQPHTCQFTKPSILRLTTQPRSPPYSIHPDKQLQKKERMSAPKNQAAWLKKAGTPLEVSDAPLPTAGPGEIVIKNAAIAINPLDCHMQDQGFFVQQWPAIFGCDVAGEVYEAGPDVQGFKKGDRVIG